MTACSSCPALHGQNGYLTPPAHGRCPHSPLPTSASWRPGERSVQRGGSQRRAQTPAAGHPHILNQVLGMSRSARGDDLAATAEARPEIQAFGKKPRRRPRHRRDAAGARCPDPCLQGAGNRFWSTWRCSPPGFDAPTSILIAMLRPTESVSLSADRGRGLRLSPGVRPIAWYSTHAGNNFNLFAPEVGAQTPRRAQSCTGALPRLLRLCQHLLGQDRRGGQGGRANTVAAVRLV